MSKGDFLSILLEDDLFMKDETMIVDECATFMAAATQTTSLLIQNFMFFLIQDPELMK